MATGSSKLCLLFFSSYFTVILLSTHNLGVQASLLEGHGSHDHDHHHADHHHDAHHHDDSHQHQKHSAPDKVESPAREDRKLKTKNANQRQPKNIQNSFLLRIPKTGFSCKDRAPGYYADMEAECQVYHMCQGRGGGRPFLCPEGTKFNQRTFVCDHAARVKCSEASNFFHRNVIIEETKSSNTGRKLSDISPIPLEKKPRLEESPIINIKVPNTIQSRSNGRMAFAPLFEQDRQKNMDKFFKMVSKFDQPAQANSRSGDRSMQRSSILDPTQDLILGLPELPFEPPIQTADPDDGEDNEIDYDEYSENGKLQLLPKKQAGKSVARFHKDREHPDQTLVPPPPLQLVGHIMDKEDIKFMPNSPIFNISLNSSARLLTVPIKTEKSSNQGDTGRHGKSGDHALGLPLHLTPPNPVHPSPLVWISPASLARSPMVLLRRLQQESSNEEVPLERSLTMTFPARNSRRFDPQCLACFPDGTDCPVNCLAP